jgi:hypothetical protein
MDAKLLQSRPVHLLRGFKYLALSQWPYATSFYQGVGHMVQSRLKNELAGAYNCVNVEFAIDQYGRTAFLSFEGARKCDRRRPPFAEVTLETIVLVLLTMYKLLSYRKEMNRP